MNLRRSFRTWIFYHGILKMRKRKMTFWRHSFRVEASLLDTFSLINRRRTVYLVSSAVNKKRCFSHQMNDFILWKEIEMLGLLMISSVAASQLGNALTRLNAASFPSFFLNPRALAAANPSTKGQAKKGFSSSELATARREALSRPTFTRLLLFDTVTSNNLNTSRLTSTKVNLNYYFCCRMYMKVIVVIVRRRIHRVLNACNECVKEFT